MMDPQKLKVLCIDLDGTLADSIPLLYSVYRAFLASQGKEGSRREFDTLSGALISDVIEQLKQRHQLLGDSATLLEEYMEELYSHYTQNLQLFAGARTFLHYIHDLGIKIVLVTSASQKLATAFLQAEDIDHLFDELVTGDTAAGKPDPALYQRALFLSQADTSEAVAIEDSEPGVKAAVAADIFTLQITHGTDKLVRIGDAKVMQVSDWHTTLALFRTWYGEI